MLTALAVPTVLTELTVLKEVCSFKLRCLLTGVMWRETEGQAQCFHSNTAEVGQKY